MTKRIGEMHAFALRNLNRFGITPLRSILSPQLFLEAQERPAGPSTILIPEIVFWLMATVALTRHSMAGAITRFWSTCGTLWALPSVRPVTEEAFCIARRKLKGRFFKRIFKTVIERYQRCFPDYETLALLMFRGADYLFRLQWKRFDHYRQHPTGSGIGDEWYITLELPERLRRQHPHLPPEVTARVLRYQIPGFRPSLLITSLLETETYDYTSLVSLYHERWRQETMHREWKHSLSMSEFRSHTIRGIFKEVYVQLILNNVLRWLMSESCQETDRCPVDLKYLECKRLLLSYTDAMARVPVHQLPLIYTRLIAEIAQQKILVRPNRSYPRKHDNKIRWKGNGKCVPPARILPQRAGTK